MCAELAQVAYREGQIRTCPQHGVHQGANRRLVRDVGNWSSGCRACKLEARFYRSRDGLAVCHLKAAKDRVEIGALRERHGACGAVARYSDPENVFGLAKILHVERRIEEGLNFQDDGERTARNSGVVHVEEKDGYFGATGKKINAMVSLRAAETERLERRVYLLVPLPARLLEAVEGLVELADEILLAKNDKTFGLRHKDIFLEIPVEEGRVDVHLVDVPVVFGGECENDSNGHEFGDRREMSR